MLTDAERVLIAKDALAWLRAGALRAMTGTYLDPLDPQAAARLFGGEADPVQLRDVVLGPCHVCAVGALFIAAIVRNNNCTVGEFRTGATQRLLGRWFERKQVIEIETAFERFERFGGSRAAVCFGSRYPILWRRLEAILQNIIDHEGRFVPEES